jgi:hypothetical protein
MIAAAKKEGKFKGKLWLSYSQTVFHVNSTKVMNFSRKCKVSVRQSVRAKKSCFGG